VSLLITIKYKKDWLYVTYLPDKNTDILADKETFTLWLRFLPIERILKGNCKVLFWETADIGLYQPFAEIQYERIANREPVTIQQH